MSRIFLPHCPPANQYFRLVLDPKDKVGKVTSGSHADRSLLLKNTWPVLCHSVLVGSTLLLSYCSLPHTQCQSCCSRGLHWFCLALCCRQEFPEHMGVFRLTGMQRSDIEEEGKGESSAELHVICHPRFQFKLLSQLSSNSDNLWLGCRVFACHCVWHEGHTLLLLPFLVE